MGMGKTKDVKQSIGGLENSLQGENLGSVVFFFDKQFCGWKVVADTLQIYVAIFTRCQAIFHLV